MGFSVYDAAMSQTPPTGESVSVAAQWRLTGGSIQAIDCYLMTDLLEFSSSKLSEIDWEILEGLEVVLVVCLLLDPGPDPSSHHGDRSLISSRRQCHLSQHQFYHVRSAISSC